MSGWSAVFFDLDGTLADTVDLIVRCYRHMVEVHREEPIDDEFWLSSMGRPLRDQIRELVSDEDEVERMANTYATYQRTIHDDMVKPFPGAVETVEALKAAGTRVAIVTSKRRRMAERTLKCCGLEGAFDLVVCADDVTKGKPDPEPVRLALHTLGLSAQPERVLFVGDAPYDIMSGRAAGTRTAAVEWGSYARAVLDEAGPDYWLGSLRETLDLRP
jgi:pyrophosphatase PpaX